MSSFAGSYCSFFLSAPFWKVCYPVLFRSISINTTFLTSLDPIGKRGLFVSKGTSSKLGRLVSPVDTLVATSIVVGTLVIELGWRILHIILFYFFLFASIK